MKSHDCEQLCTQTNGVSSRLVFALALFRVSIPLFARHAVLVSVVCLISCVSPMSLIFLQSLISVISLRIITSHILLIRLVSITYPLPSPFHLFSPLFVPSFFHVIFAPTLPGLVSFFLIVPQCFPSLLVFPRPCCSYSCSFTDHRQWQQTLVVQSREPLCPCPDMRAQSPRTKQWNEVTARGFHCSARRLEPHPIMVQRTRKTT